MKRRISGAHLAGVVLATLMLSPESAAQGSPSDAWKKAPAAPTSCFRDDGYSEKADAAIVELEAEIGRQGKVNAALKEKFDKMDMSEKAQRMQAFMMKNPQQAMKMMQAEQAAGASITSAVTDADGSMKSLEPELTRLQAKYKEEVDKALAPILAAQKQLIETRTRPMGEASIPQFVAAADHARYVALIKQENEAYEGVCATYYKPGATFPAWLARYKSNVIEKVASVAEANDGVVTTQMAIMDTPTGGYRSTASLGAVRDYLRKSILVYSHRRGRAVATLDLIK